MGLGVKVGWAIQLLDGKPFSEFLLGKLARANEPFKITFAAFIAGPLASTSAPGEDPEERKTLSDLWKEGDEEADSDWLSGTGLKFHTTADKAFAMDSKRFKDISQNTG